jgi:hypothetical protein
MAFTDYARPSLRLAALMGAHVVHVFSHDSIGLGEDGPTHQPVEHFAALRAIPNLLLWRPADAVETVECWQAALAASHSPSILALTRQNLPALRKVHVAENLCALGAYEISAAPEKAAVSIFASGSEVSIAVAAQKLLAEKNVAARVVSVPCFDRFFEQNESYRAGQGRRRGGGAAGLGRADRRRPVRRHDVIRRQRPVQTTVRVLWHNGREGGRSGARSARRLTRNAAKRHAFLDLDQSGRVDSLLIPGLDRSCRAAKSGARDRREGVVRTRL